MAIKIEQALELILKRVDKKSLKLLPIESVLGYVLAQDVKAKYNLPPFDNSAMDGYAVKLSDNGNFVKVENTIFAGDNSNLKLEAGYGIKIMTGAKIPQGTECIVPIEDTICEKDGVILPNKLTKLKHIRFCGEDIKEGNLLLRDGDRLNAHQITILASQGISHIKVYKKPLVTVFSSGSELKMHFENVTEYQLYNTNTPALLSRALEFGCAVDFLGTAKDSLEEIKEHIQSALESDFIITSGGVSVGDADYTKEAFNAFGYEIFFDKIDIKPGKPTTFGKIGDTFILNLPGNPLAAALNFELFGQTIILALSGDSSKYINSIKAKIKNDYKLKAGRRTLVPGYFDGEFFTPSQNFAPGMITPLSIANSFIMIDENTEFIPNNGEVKIISTRFSFNSKKRKELVTKHSKD